MLALISLLANACTRGPPILNKLANVGRNQVFNVLLVILDLHGVISGIKTARCDHSVKSNNNNNKLTTSSGQANVCFDEFHLNKSSLVLFLIF